MNFKLKNYQDFLITNKTLLKLSQNEQEEMLKNSSVLATEVVNYKEAREVMSMVGIASQQRVKETIESLVTQALVAVFGDKYSFELVDKIARNKSEIEMFVVEDGIRRSLKDELGCGVLDVVSLFLRIIFWAIQFPRTRNTLIFDEPAKFLSKDKLSLLQGMIKKISEMLNVQIIMITHEHELAEGSDLIYHVDKVGEVSQVS
jgi:DNA repair exonuclease SbcCD ATPase subunit